MSPRRTSIASDNATLRMRLDVLAAEIADLRNSFRLMAAEVLKLRSDASVGRVGGESLTYHATGVELK